MTEDGLIREIQLKQQLSELDGSRVSEYDPSDGMETVEELKKYVRFLYASLQEKDRENLQMKKDMSDIKEELKAANRRADEEAAGRKRLFDKLERFMDEQKSASDEVEKLKRKLETAENRLALANAAVRHYFQVFQFSAVFQIEVDFDFRIVFQCLYNNFHIGVQIRDSNVVNF